MIPEDDIVWTTCKFSLQDLDGQKVQVATFWNGHCIECDIGEFIVTEHGLKPGFLSISYQILRPGGRTGLQWVRMFLNQNGVNLIEPNDSPNFSYRIHHSIESPSGTQSVTD
jgi:hypothetical protein